MKHITFVIGCLLFMETACRAATLQITNNPALGLLNQSGLFSTSTFTPSVVGYQFTALTDMQIVSLGVFDAGGNGLNAANQVGIFNLSGQLLRQIAVGPSSQLRGDFRYELLALPLVVDAGTSLRVAHFVVAADPWVFRADVTDFSPLIKYDGSMSTTTSNPSALVYPNGNFSSRREYLGTDFEFQVVPEPSSLSMMSLAVFVLMRRSRK